MIFRQFIHDDLGCGSYLVGDDDAGVAAVVDPKLDIEEYLAMARYMGVRIEHILETHNHADHVSGHGRLAAATGATIHIHRLAGAGLRATSRSTTAGSSSSGRSRSARMHTPGHRPEHTAFALIDKRRGPEPWAVLSGDTLFVGDIARPDLAIEKEEGAHEIFRSLHDKLLALPGECEVLARPRGRLAVRRPGDGHEGQLDDRVRAPPQPRCSSSRTKTRSCAPRPRSSPAAAELQGDRGDQPGSAAHRRLRRARR